MKIRRSTTGFPYPHNFSHHKMIHSSCFLSANPPGAHYARHALHVLTCLRLPPYSMHARTHQRKHTHLHSRSPFCFIHCKPFQLPIGYGVNLCHVYFCLFFVCFPLVASRLTSGAAVDRHDSERHHTAVINLLDTRNDRIEEDNAGVARTTADYDNSYYYEDNYDNEEEDYELSVAMSSKPKDSASILSVPVEQPERPQRRGKGKKKGKGQGRKRNPCLKKYKNFCIHGTCQYYKDLRAASCV